jgi:plasmid stabilization system protein ParE
MSLAWHVRLASQAEQDLLDITLWTAENFGTRQAEHYAKTIALAIEA